MNKIKTPIKTYERLQSIMAMLETKASEPEPCCWIVDENGDDSDESYCFDCIKALVANPVHGENYSRAGYAFDSDSALRCEKCGKLLDYILTDYGVHQELDHFIEYPPENLDDAVECFELERIAASMYGIEQTAKFLKVFCGIKIEAQPE